MDTVLPILLVNLTDSGPEKVLLLVGDEDASVWNEIGMLNLAPVLPDPNPTIFGRRGRCNSTLSLPQWRSRRLVQGLVVTIRFGMIKQFGQHIERGQFLDRSSRTLRLLPRGKRLKVRLAQRIAAVE